MSLRKLNNTNYEFETENDYLDTCCLIPIEFISKGLEVNGELIT